MPIQEVHRIHHSPVTSLLPRDAL